MANVLNFSIDNLITGVNVIDNNLYWTDDRNEPKKIEIDRWKATDISVSGSTTAVDNRLFSHEDITVIRPHPTEVIELELTEYTPTDAAPESPFENIYPRFSYRWRYEDGQYSPYAPFTQAAFIPEARTADTTVENYTEGFNTTMFNNVGRITLNNIPRGGPDVIEVELLYTESISSTIYVLETLLIPEDQRGIDYVLSTGYVERVQANDFTGIGNVERTDYTFLPLTYSLSTRKIFSALPANQLTRPFDHVPRLAKAQEVTANRLVYANYLQNYNQPSGVNIDITTIPAESFPQYITPYTDPTRFNGANHYDYNSGIDTHLRGLSAQDGLHVKGNRTYEIGVAYIDSFGRQGAMLQNVTTFNIDGSLNEAGAFRTAFHQATREALQVTITSQAPDWADSYRYFVKDVSQDYHNLISYNIYNDGSSNDIDSDFVWIEFQSTDRNKIQEGDTLVLRRTNDDVETMKQRFLVQDIENQAPDDVRAQLTQILTNIEFSRVGGLTSGHTGITTGATSIVLETGSSGVERDNFQSLVVDPFNAFIRGNQPTMGTAIEEISVLGSGTLAGSAADLTQLTSPLYARFTSTSQPEIYVEVLSITNLNSDADITSPGRQLKINFGQRLRARRDAQGGFTPVTDSQGEILMGVPAVVSGDLTLELNTTTQSDSSNERLQGRFWIRTARNGLAPLRSTFTFEGEIIELQQLWFETEPAVADSLLDLFWETSDTFCICTDHGWPNKLNWFNCVAEVTSTGVYLESTRINDRFNTVQLVKGVRVNVPTERFAEERRPYGLIHSGIYNSRTGINRLNEFIFADGITKEVEPNYGSIQKLHTRNTNLVVLAEDKVFNILADKDLLFNADGGGNVAATQQVLGQTTAYIGEYGIGKAPESFATYGHQAWFADPVRGTIIQFTPATGGQSQLFEISSRGMSDFFRDRLFSSTRIHGMFDEYGDKYIVSLQGYNAGDPVINDRRIGEPLTGTADSTLGYELDVEGWPSFQSFIPEDGISLGNKFFTWNNGQLYLHNSNTADRNTFYGNYTESHVQVIFNDNPSSVKEFLTIGYEGTSDWTISNIDTESNDTAIDALQLNQVTREGKHFIPIVSEVPNTYVMDPAGTFLGSDGNMYRGEGTKLKSGIKGFFNNVTLTNSSISPAELFAVNTENFVSSN